MNSLTGVLLVNLGTPKSPTLMAVMQFLREFLLDPRVIDLPTWFRKILVNGYIVPFRMAQTRRAYQSIWTKKGSPLAVYSQDLKVALSKQLGPQFRVALGMRYSRPSMADALAHLMEVGCTQLIVVPLFPQYASATSGSIFVEITRLISLSRNIPSMHFVHHFCCHPSYIQALAQSIRPVLNQFKPDKLLMSYHGLPLRQLPQYSRLNLNRKSERACCVDMCDQSNPCPHLADHNNYCYRAQCYATSRAVAKALNLLTDQYTVSFQSRLGRTPWIQPYTDQVLNRLFQQGVRRLAVVCPSFVTDCLETLEEMGIRGREQWLALGGESFHLIPCLNASGGWVKGLADMIELL